MHRLSVPRFIGVGLVGALGVGLAATPAPSQDAAGQAAPAPPVAYASVSELNGILAQLQQTTKNIQSDLEKTRIEKWKLDSSTKRKAISDSDSIRRSLQTAIPDTIAQLNNSPEDVGVSFKLYRYLDALYDVFGSVAELAGAYGSKDEAQDLGNDLNGLQAARHAFGDRLQKLAGAKEEELGHLRAQVKTLSAGPPPPPKKIIIDDTEPAPKKPAAKKKTTKPAAPANPPAGASKPSPNQ
jgi:hypothetical protein